MSGSTILRTSAVVPGKTRRTYVSSKSAQVVVSKRAETLAPHPRCSYPCGHCRALPTSLGISSKDIEDVRSTKTSEVISSDVNLRFGSANWHRNGRSLVEEKYPHKNLLNSASIPVVVSFASAFSDLRGNHVFLCAFLSWLVAQVAKIFTAYYREGRWDYRVMFDSGGMPSSHTSLVVGLTTSIVHQHGLGSVYFPLALAFSLIVMYDAAGVRRHAGKQAEVLNKILADTFHGTPLSNTKLKEVLGHSPLQVVCGAILGVFVSSFYMLKFGF